MSNLIELNKVASLQKENKSILGVFEKAVSRFRIVNEKIAKAKLIRVNKIDKLQGEFESLEVAEARNNKIQSKLEEFLEL